MVKTTLQQPGKRFNSIYMASDFYHLDLLEHRATTSAGKSVSILRVTAETNYALSSFLAMVVCLSLVLV